MTDRLLRRGDGFGRIGIGCPWFSAKGGYEFFRWWSWLLVAGLEVGDILLNDAEVPGEYPMPALHNILVRRFLALDADTLCIVEDDHTGRHDVIERMRFKSDNVEFDIVCATYVNRRGIPVPVGVYLHEPNAAGEYACRHDWPNIASTGTQEYDCAALGLVLIRRWVLEAILGDRDPELMDFFPIRGRNSLDVGFYAQARSVGARVGVDRDNRLGHVGKKIWRFDEFLEWREKYLPAEKLAEVRRGQENLPPPAFPPVGSEIGGTKDG